MDDVAVAINANADLRKVRINLLQWELKDCPLAQLTSDQDDAIDSLFQVLLKPNVVSINSANSLDANIDSCKPEIVSKSFQELYKNNSVIGTTHDFLILYDDVNNEIHDYSNKTYLNYLNQLQSRYNDCCFISKENNISIEQLRSLKFKFDFVSKKTNSLNVSSEKLLEEQNKLHDLRKDIQNRLYQFLQVEQISQKLASPTLSITSTEFEKLLNQMDSCSDYLTQHQNYKDAPNFIVKYKHCLSKAILLIRNYISNIMLQATEQILSPKGNNQQNTTDTYKTSSEAAFALYYGKFQCTASKVKKLSSLIEERIKRTPEYGQLLSEIQNCYLTERANVMSSAVYNSIKGLESKNKRDHCSLVRSACGLLVHVCQDEHRLYYQFFSLPSNQLNSYLDGLCTILYDTLRPYIIHINHLETLAEICSILRIEMLDEHIQQNSESLESLGRTVFQLLQDVQERLVFRAHLYLQTDILNYKPSPGDLSYPEKLEMMESIAVSLHETELRRSEFRISVTSNASTSQNADNIDYNRIRTINSPADLHGMWYPTVRRTLICLSRLYRCVDRHIFQGLSQEALKYCIQSVSVASDQISSSKSKIDGTLFEIKHLLILREQIAPFRVDFTIKETSLDFSKVKTAAFGLLQKRNKLFSFGTNNALLEFLLEGTPQVKEHLLDSRKDVDRQLKTVCEFFIKHCVQIFVGPILSFVEKADGLLSEQINNANSVSTAQQNLLLKTSWASPQLVGQIVQETQRVIKNRLTGLQRSMQLYLSNKDTEFIIFRSIKNNIISAFIKLEQMLVANGYSADDMLIISCPSAEQVSILLSSVNILADDPATCGRKSPAEGLAHQAPDRKPSVEKKVSFGGSVTEAPENRFVP